MPVGTLDIKATVATVRPDFPAWKKMKKLFLCKILETFLVDF